MITVSHYDPKTQIVYLESDEENTAAQLTDLRQPGVEDIALRYAAQNGIVIDGTMDLGGRNMRFFGSETGEEISSGDAMRGHTPKGNDRVTCRRMVKLAISSSSQSSLANMPIAQRKQNVVRPKIAKASKPKRAKS